MTQTPCCGGDDIFSEESQSSQETFLCTHSASGTTAALAFHSKHSDSWRVLTSARDFAVAFLFLALSSHGHSTSSRAYRGLVKVRDRSDWNCLLSCSSKLALYSSSNAAAHALLVDAPADAPFVNAAAYELFVDAAPGALLIDAAAYELFVVAALDALSVDAMR